MAFTFDTEAKALEAISSSFVFSFVLFRMFCNNKQLISISAMDKQHQQDTCVRTRSRQCVSLSLLKGQKAVTYFRAGR